MGAAVTGELRRIGEDWALAALAGAVVLLYMDGARGQKAIWRARRAAGGALVLLGERLMPRVEPTPARVEIWWDMDEDDETGDLDPSRREGR